MGKQSFRNKSRPNLKHITQTCSCNILHVFFTAIKNGNFQMKKCNVSPIFAQNIDHGYTLETPN